MMKKVLYMLFLSCIISINACQNDRKISYKYIENGRYRFEFQIPVTWSAIDSSTNGDGFFIQTDNPETDIRVYAQYFLQQRMDASCEWSKAFIFNDGHVGSICSMNENELMFYRNDSHIQLTMYVKATKDWIENHKTEFYEMAKSIAPIVADK